MGGRVGPDVPAVRERGLPGVRLRRVRLLCLSCGCVRLSACEAGEASLATLAATHAAGLAGLGQSPLVLIAEILAGFPAGGEPQALTVLEDAAAHDERRYAVRGKPPGIVDWWPAEFNGLGDEVVAEDHERPRLALVLYEDALLPALVSVGAHVHGLAFPCRSA